jgi:hypothetical protein
MMKVIFGSGIIGLIAKCILGPDWTVIPFYKSRFFSFNPALDDNFIVRDERIDEVIYDVAGIESRKLHLYQRAWSISGEVSKGYKGELYYPWAYKLFGADPPSHVEPYFKSQMVVSVYDLRANQLYSNLLNAYSKDLVSEAAKGTVTEIGDHYFVRNGKRYDFDAAINTIPLDKLLDLMSVKHALKSKALHYLHVQSNELDFEGANQLLVVDREIGFYKVTNVAPNRYLFYCHEDIVNPGTYLMSFMKSFDILDGTSIDGVIPLGSLPNLDDLDKKGIHCIGSSAQWDWCMDISSCMIRLVRYAGEGSKYATRKSHSSL